MAGSLTIAQKLAKLVYADGVVARVGDLDVFKQDVPHTRVANL